MTVFRKTTDQLERTILHTLWVILLLVIFVGCTQEEGQKALPKESLTSVSEVDQQPREVFNVAMPLQQVELASEALAVWRQYSAQQPTLLLLSDIPMILPLPEQTEGEIKEFIQTADQRELARRSQPREPELLLYPEMTVDAALRMGWLGQFVWALPLPDSVQSLTVEKFRDQLGQRGLITPEEAQSLSGNDREIRGMLRGIPTLIASLENLPEIRGPVVLHIDMSYFERLYNNEVSTPVLNIVFEALSKLRERQIQTLAVTFSYGHLDERLALDVRFLGEVVKGLCEQPDRFLEPAPLAWQRQGEILYLSNFFQKEKILELSLALEEELPHSPWVKFNLFRVAADHKVGDAALEYLRQAVSLDRIYALEYLSLADLAYDMERPADALRMINLADEALPGNPLIELKAAQLSDAVGETAAAIEIVTSLQGRQWSQVYHAGMPEYLDEYLAYLSDRKGEVRSLIKSMPGPEAKRRQRVLHSQ